MTTGDQTIAGSKSFTGSLTAVTPDADDDSANVASTETDEGYGSETSTDEDISYANYK